MHVVWGRMEDVLAKGFTKSIGVSNVNVQLLADMLCYCKVKPAVNQIELNPMCVQPELVQFLKENDV